MPPIRAYIPTATTLAATVLMTGVGISHTLAQRADRLTRDEAIAAVVQADPKLEAYTSVSSPLLAIETKETPAGWHVAFVKKHQDAATVAEASCYYASTGGTVSPTGTYAPEKKDTSFSFHECAHEPEETFELAAPPVRAIAVEAPAPKPKINETCTCPEAQNMCSRWATCERTTSGQCVLKQTPELTACLANPAYAQM